MNAPSLSEILGNISQTLGPIQGLLSTLAYIFGLLLYYAAIQKLRIIGDFHARGASHEKMFIPVTYILMGSLLFYLPTALHIFTATAFGTGSILQYGNTNPYNIQNSISNLLQVVGFIWFIRGCILLAQASNPGVQHGPKGLAFLCAGIFAINIDKTTGAINYIIDKITSMTLSISGMTGFNV